MGKKHPLFTWQTIKTSLHNGKDPTISTLHSNCGCQWLLRVHAGAGVPCSALLAPQNKPYNPLIVLFTQAKWSNAEVFLGSTSPRCRTLPTPTSGVTEFSVSSDLFCKTVLSCGGHRWFRIKWFLNPLVLNQPLGFLPQRRQAMVDEDTRLVLFCLSDWQNTEVACLFSFGLSVKAAGLVVDRRFHKASHSQVQRPLLNAWQEYEILYHYLDLIRMKRSISTY